MTVLLSTSTSASEGLISLHKVDPENSFWTFDRARMELQAVGVRMDLAGKPCHSS